MRKSCIYGIHPVDQFMVTGFVMLNVLISFDIHILPFSFSAC